MLEKVVLGLILLACVIWIIRYIRRLLQTGSNPSPDSCGNCRCASQCQANDPGLPADSEDNKTNT